ncbi:hypothetical protein QBC33DRAFT_316719 [Phialemonium atrogriseum]|uniref:Uncharacterized protein n=1 Tax=Phialemonium atrogriseum TaxID=1093897 RepID=A0AAJ0FH87_9PEZI|nr:uncharacterized protein QBC33DRAFT_316719 [Phialemonium atrogriseum]KAK1761909.1 hypothetical protein QBC33DRAFT_316719 [Phialemonium atrogriseum]
MLDRSQPSPTPNPDQTSIQLAIPQQPSHKQSQYQQPNPPPPCRRQTIAQSPPHISSLSLSSACHNSTNQYHSVSPSRHPSINPGTNHPTNMDRLDLNIFLDWPGREKETTFATVTPKTTALAVEKGNATRTSGSPPAPSPPRTAARGKGSRPRSRQQHTSSDITDKYMAATIREENRTREPVEARVGVAKICTCLSCSFLFCGGVGVEATGLSRPGPGPGCLDAWIPGFLDLELELELEPRAWNLGPRTSLTSPAYLDPGNVAFT